MDAERTRRIQQRLDDLHGRHLDLGEAEEDVVRYYSPERGYYGPDQADEESERFSICLVGVDGSVHLSGDHDAAFALSSLSKVFVYGLALEEHGRDEVERQVGVKPSADSFAALGFDEHTNRPYNPMVNAGALATSDLVLGEASPETAFQRVLDVLRRYSGNESLVVDERTFEAEMRGADRNRATA